MIHATNYYTTSRTTDNMNENRDREGYFDPFAVERPARQQGRSGSEERRPEDIRPDERKTEATPKANEKGKERRKEKEDQRYRRRTERFVTFSIRRDIIAMLRTVQAVLQLTGRPRTSMNNLLHGFTCKCVKQDYPEAWHLIESRAVNPETEANTSAEANGHASKRAYAEDDEREA